MLQWCNLSGDLPASPPSYGGLTCLSRRWDPAALISDDPLRQRVFVHYSPFEKQRENANCKPDEEERAIRRKREQMMTGRHEPFLTCQNPQRPEFWGAWYGDTFKTTAYCIWHSPYDVKFRRLATSTKPFICLFLHIILSCGRSNHLFEMQLTALFMICEEVWKKISY